MKGETSLVIVWRMLALILLMVSLYNSVLSQHLVNLLYLYRFNAYFSAISDNRSR